ncbi:unnamed protein product [Ranitomeya imitator]|uniref:F-box domain-containing protein n=1 Tax=Ranitomeya imitator TaxID=111125 RepID=A0ABN9M529_9NEOB|nr:unnamed protein product [Ranitomeya imitator]
MRDTDPQMRDTDPQMRDTDPQMRDRHRPPDERHRPPDERDTDPQMRDTDPQLPWATEALSPGTDFRLLCAQERNTKHLQEIPASAGNTSRLSSLSWDAKRSSDLLSGLGVTPMGERSTGHGEHREHSPGPSRAHDPSSKEAETEGEGGRGVFSLPDAPGHPGLLSKLLLAIFSYLHLTDLMLVPRVCKQWSRVSCDESLWHSVDLTNKHMAAGVIGNLLSLGVVVLRCPRSCIGEPLFRQVRPLRLQHVDFSNCTITPESLKSIISRCHNLRNLSLEGLELSDDVMW